MKNSAITVKIGSAQKLKISRKSIGLIIISLLSGLINGLLGAGGGIILSLGFSSLIGDELGERKDVYFNSQAAMVPVCVVSYLLYVGSGEMSAISLRDMLFPAILGGVAGGILSAFIKSKYIRLIFAIIVLFSGIRMLMSVL